MAVLDFASDCAFVVELFYYDDAPNLKYVGVVFLVIPTAVNTALFGSVLHKEFQRLEVIIA